MGKLTEEDDRTSSEMDYVRQTLEIADEYWLTTEVVYFALLYLQENPNAPIELALDYGIEEWIK